MAADPSSSMSSASDEPPRIPWGYHGDRLCPLDDLVLPVTDAGFIHGVTIAEQVRTFGGQPFLLDRHYQRWQRGLDWIGLGSPCDYEELSQRIQQLLALNARLLVDGGEQGICFLATPGSQPSFTWQLAACPSSQSVNCYIHTYPLGESRWKPLYRQGARLVTTAIRDVPDQCWPKDIKLRSRAHYYRAQRQAAATHPAAFPILLDLHGTVSDSAIGSLVAYSRASGLIVRDRASRFASISVEFVIELAEQLGIPVHYQNLTPDELVECDEAWLVSTPWCMLPVAMLDDRPLTGGHHFAMFHRLLDAWSQQVGARID